MRLAAPLAGLLFLAGAAIAGPGTASAASYGTIYAFGDSLTDSGNVYTATFGAEPLSPPYWRGRFSNGPNWSQDLAAALGARRLLPSLQGGTDFAYGGAQTGATAIHALAATDLPSQLAQFVATVPRPSPAALYTLWIGANDLFQILDTPGLSQPQVAQVVGQSIGNQAAFVTAIAALGAAHLLLVTVPDLGHVPAITALGPAASAAATALATSYNQQLLSTLQPLAALFGIDLRVVDSYALIDAAIADPAADGFTDVTDPCWTGSYTSPAGTLCSHSFVAQNDYLFWDSIHPTAHGHKLVATAAQAALRTGK